jgi:2,5-furandicarboxylate decarboxylase 1
LPLDPSLAGATTGAKAGFDLTLPIGERILEHRVPQPPHFDGRRFDSLQAALADGPKFFGELMAATGSRDGREIVRELEGLRRAGKLSRDGEGRYEAIR